MYNKKEPVDPALIIRTGEGQGDISIIREG